MLQSSEHVLRQASKKAGRSNRARKGAHVSTYIITPEKIWRSVNLPLSLLISCPPIGLPTNTAMATKVKSVPVLTPIWRTSESPATHAGMTLTMQPDVNPKRAAKTIMAALLLAGIHMPRTSTVVITIAILKTLKRPYLSARPAGIVRPKTLQGRCQLSWPTSLNLK